MEVSKQYGKLYLVFQSKKNPCKTIIESEAQYDSPTIITLHRTV